jgi:hypothetical protein
LEQVFIASKLGRNLVMCVEGEEKRQVFPQIRTMNLDKLGMLAEMLMLCNMRIVSTYDRSNRNHRLTTPSSNYVSGTKINHLP